MNYHDKMEVILIGTTCCLCLLLLYKILCRLRSTLPWRVNCWFCNSYSWVKYPDNNSWTCPHCEQYNGFTKDGDYNKTLTTVNDPSRPMTPKVFHKSPPKNGLCKMCNINQQLKVTQLANFVPMNEKNFDEEIEAYRTQLEKAYKLCSPCKKTLQIKLYKEKEILLGSKLLETRVPEKKITQHEAQTALLKNFINNTSMLITFILLLLVSYELYRDLKNNKNLPKTISNAIQIIRGLLDRLYSIMKMKLYLTFPSIESYISDLHIYTVDLLPKTFNFRLNLDKFNIMTQKALGGFVCLIQIVANIWNVNSLKYTIIIDLMWSIFVICIGEYIDALNPLFTIYIKMMCALTLLLVYNNMKENSKSTPNSHSSIKKMKNLANASMNGFFDDEDAMNLDTDDDVSLSKFGVHNHSESSNDTASPLNASLMNGRSFTPRNDSIWTKPKLNSTFCVNSMMSKSPSSVSDTIFAKPCFDSYRKLAKDDSDSDLDQSISSLSIGPTKTRKKKNSVFSLRKFTATPSFVAPMPTASMRPMISPSKLGHSTSWVAGGYWGAESERQNIINADGSRSSSQSSGFESQASSMTQRNVFSQPPSREESVCGEPMVLDRYPNVSNLSSYQSQNQFSRIGSPIFPQMQFNNHVHIPQARFSQRSVPPSVFGQQTQTLFTQRSMFKPPGGSGLIKLPQVNTFSR